MANALDKWLSNGSEPLVIKGPLGSGKTTLIKKAIKKWQSKDSVDALDRRYVVDVDPGTYRTANQIQEKLGSLSFNPLSMRHVLVVDGVDGMTAGAISALVKYGDGKGRVILAAVDLNASLKKLKTKITLPVLKGKKLEAVLRKYVKEEHGHEWNAQIQSLVSAICEQCVKGDVRHALLTLEFQLRNLNEDVIAMRSGPVAKTPFDATKNILKGKVDLKTRVNNYFVEPFMVQSTVLLTAPRCLTSLKDVAQVSEIASNADMMNEVLRKTQNYSIMPYHAHMIAGVGNLTRKGKVPFPLSFPCNHSGKLKNRNDLLQSIRKSGLTRLDGVDILRKKMIQNLLNDEVDIVLSDMTRLRIDEDQVMGKDGLIDICFGKNDEKKKIKAKTKRSLKKAWKLLHPTGELEKRKKSRKKK